MDDKSDGHIDPKKQRILLVHNYYQIGGGEHTVFENETALLRSKGHFILTYIRRNDELKSNKWKLILSPFTTLWSIKTYREVRNLIKIEKIDVVHCHNTFPLISPSVYYAALSRNIPILQTIHNFRFLCPNGIFYRAGRVCEDCLEQSLTCSMKHDCYRNSKIQTLTVALMLSFHRMIGTYRKINYIFLTEFSKRKFMGKLKISERKTFVKPNFTPYIKNEREILTSDDNYFVYVGRISEEKGIIDLCEYWSKNQTKPLMIFGSGDLESKVKRFSNNCPYIKFFGFTQTNEIKQYLQKAKALIFPSKCYEGFPMVILEAMSLGIPVICRNIGNQADIVQEGINGFHYSNDQELTSACSAATTNKMSDSVFELFDLKYSELRNYDTLLSIYDEITHK